MIFWLNAQLPPSFANWLTTTFGIGAVTLRDLGLRDASDVEIFNAARANGIGTVVVTKDRDFIDLVVRFGSPHQIIWLTCGNMTNRDLQQIFIIAFPQAIDLLNEGESLVEIGR